MVARAPQADPTGPPTPTSSLKLTSGVGDQGAGSPTGNCSHPDASPVPRSWDSLAVTLMVSCAHVVTPKVTGGVTHTAGRQDSGPCGGAGSPEADPPSCGHPAGFPDVDMRGDDQRRKLLRLTQKWVPASHRQAPKRCGCRPPRGPRQGARGDGPESSCCTAGRALNDLNVFSGRMATYFLVHPYSAIPCC